MKFDFFFRVHIYLFTLPAGEGKYIYFHEEFRNESIEVACDEALSYAMGHLSTITDKGSFYGRRLIYDNEYQRTGGEDCASCHFNLMLVARDNNTLKEAEFSMVDPEEINQTYKLYQKLIDNESLKKCNVQ